MKEKILVIRFSSLGDVLLTSAAILNLKLCYPDSYLAFLTKEKFRSAAELIDGIDEIVVIEPGLSPLAYARLLLDLDGRNFTLLVDLHGNPRSWLARKIISADRTVVYPKRRFQRLLAVKRKVIPENYPHTIDLYNEALRQLTVPTPCRRPQAKVPDKAMPDPMARFVSGGRSYVVIAPGAAHPNKQWPLERFVEVAAALYHFYGLKIVWAITAAEKGEGAPTEQLPNEACLTLVDQSLDLLASLIAGASLTIANDSGIAHLSSAVGTPVVTVFGPTHPTLGFAPRGLRDRVVEIDESCRPCSLHGQKPCYRDQRYCLNRITPAMIVDTAASILSESDDSGRTVFIDRDGTIIVDKNFPANPDQIEFIDGSVAALRYLKDNGFKVVVVSNQSGVARGILDLESVERVNARLLERLAAEHVEIDALYYCPHYAKGSVSPYNIVCNCRKPAPGMAEEAALRLKGNLRRAWVIGDKLDDINLGKVIGARSILVRTGYGDKYKSTVETTAWYKGVSITENLLQAVKIVGTSNNHD